MTDRQPQRIQRKRTPGSLMPEDAVYVGRPSRWGNPFRIGDPNIRDAETATGYLASLIAYRAGTLPGGDVPRALPRYPSVAEIRQELAGRDLCCWCRLDSPCHAGVLLSIAAGREP